MILQQYDEKALNFTIKEDITYHLWNMLIEQ